MLHLQLNLWLKMKSLRAECCPFLLLEPQEPTGHSSLTAPQSGKLKSDGFASPCGLHLLGFTDILVYVIAGRSSMGPHISLFDLLLVFVLSCFSIQEALYGNLLTVQYSLELLHKCGSENLPESCCWTVIHPNPFLSLRATPLLLRDY